MKKALLVGFYAGLVSGAGGVAAAYFLGAVTGLWFSQLNWISIPIASIVTNIVGALIYAKWFQKTARPRLYYILLTLGITLLSSLNDVANPPEPKFGLVAHPVHVIVALLSIWLVPLWLTRGKQVQIPGNPTPAKKS